MAHRQRPVSQPWLTDAVHAPNEHDDNPGARTACRVRHAGPCAPHQGTWTLTHGRSQQRGTAGAPILRHLTGAHLVDVALVVTRWFGGTKLGRGGLVRAYRAAAAAAIAAAHVVEHCPMALSHRYADAGAVDAVLHGQATEAVASDYGATITRVVRVATAAPTDTRWNWRTPVSARAGLQLTLFTDM